MGMLSKHQSTEGGFQPFPSAKVKMEIKKTEWKENNSKNGHYLNLQCVVIKGDYKGKNVWHLLNLDNPSEEAVGISKTEAQQMLVQIHGKPKDPKNVKELQKLLSGGVIYAQVDVQESKGYKPKNVISYLIMDDDTGSNDESSSSSAPWDKEKKKKKKGKKKK